jgi:hypothetical protein
MGKPLRPRGFPGETSRSFALGTVVLSCPYADHSMGRGCVPRPIAISWPVVIDVPYGFPPLVTVNGEGEGRHGLIREFSLRPERAGGIDELLELRGRIPKPGRCAAIVVTRPLAAYRGSRATVGC